MKKALLALTLISLSCSVYASNGVLGKFASVSESEWHQILTINKDGTAILTTITWLPGHDEENKESTTFKWSYKKPTLTLTNMNIKVVLIYSKNTSLEGFQIKGTHTTISPTTREVIFLTLWKEPRSFLKEWYERAQKE